MGQVLQAGQGQIPSRQAQIKAGIPKEVSSETINKVCASGLRASVMLDQAIRAGDVRGRRGRRHGVDVEGPLPASRGPLRLSHGRRQDARRDGPRRAHQPVLGQADVRRGDGGRRRAGDDARRPRPLGAALARAGAEGHRRGPAARGDRAGHRQGPQGRHRRRDRRGPAPRHLAREARRAAGPGRQGGLAHGRQLAGRQRRRRRARAVLRGVGAAPTARRRSPRSSPTRRAPTTSPTWPRRRPAPPRRRWRRRACSPGTSTCGRSTRRSPRSR